MRIFPVLLPKWEGKEGKLVLSLLSAVLIMLSMLASVSLYGDYVEIGALQSQVEQERNGMKIDILLTVERLDAQGNVVQRVEKWNDLPTRNYIGLMMWTLGWRDNAPANILNTTLMKDIGNIARSHDTGGPDHAFGLDYVQVGWGNGTTAPTISDFEMQTLAGKDTVDQTTLFTNSTHMWLKVLMTREFTSAYTIKEIGLYARPWTFPYMTYTTATAYNTQGDPTTSTTYNTQLTAAFYDTSTNTGTRTANMGYSLGEYLLFRDVLGTPVNVPANEAVTITYWIYLKYA